MSTGQIVAALFGSGAVGAVLVAVITAITGKGQRHAEAAKILTDTATELVTPLSDQLTQTRTDLHAAQEQIRQMQAQMERMQTAMEAAYEQFSAVAQVVPRLIRLIDVVVPLIESEHPDLAGDLQSTAAEVVAASTRGDS